MNNSQNKMKVFNDKYLLNYIYEFDNTYKEIFTKMVLSNNQILEGAHCFWYDKYQKMLFTNKPYKYVMELQDAFFDTLSMIDKSFTPLNT